MINARRLVLPAICAIGMSSGPSYAQDVALPQGLISGQMAGSHSQGGGTWCAVLKGASFIQRTSATSDVVIVFPELTDHSRQTVILDGQATLKFSDASSGKVVFDINYVGTKTSVTAKFNAYDVLLQGKGRYLVLFNLFFNDFCSLNIQATYTVPP